MPLYSFSGHTHRRTDGGVAGPALTALYTLLVLEVDVRQQQSLLQLQFENVTGQEKLIRGWCRR